MVLLIIFLFIGVLGILWLILTLPPQKGAAFLAQAGPIMLMAAGGLLLFLRRGVIGLPLILLGLSWWRRMRSRQPLAQPDGRKSTVRSAHLEMELDHDTGEMDGRVLTGSMEGARLSAMSESELLSLYREICGDTESGALLESFLDRYHSSWRERYDHSSFKTDGATPGFEAMTRQEAYQILGLAPGATQEEIHQAWRRLVKAVHPDSGGSAFLTAKINAARDVLLH